VMEFGYLNIIRIDFYGFIPSCSIQFRLIRYDKHCVPSFQVSSRCLKMWSNSLSCLITCILATFIRCLIRIGILTQLCTVGYLQLYVH